MSLRSRSDVSFEKKTLPYPIFAADFDPYNRGYLVVGGGGGESKTGVPNQITVLDVSDRAEIATAVDIELTRQEDSVQSLASLSTRDGLIVFAGINSSEAEQNAGRNEHFRSFTVKTPPRKKQKTEDSSEAEKGEWKLIGKRSLFQTSTAAKKETYQRILRLSPSQRRESGSSRIGAIATGLAKDSEIVVFDATTPTPDSTDVLTRIELQEGAEAADLDIAETEQGEFSLVYCTDYDIREQTLKYDFKTKKTEKTPSAPRRVRQMPFPDALEKPQSRPKFRSLRFLNSQNIIALCNKPNRAGAELRVFHLYPTGPAIMIQQKTLPSHIKQAVSMDVCAFDADKDGNQQFAIAVAGQDISIEVYTINYVRKTDTVSTFNGYLTMKDVHEHQMTKICFSRFQPPVRAAGEGAEKKNVGFGTQYIRLASVSMGNTVVVDTFPLSLLDENKPDSRYVLSHPSDERWTMWAYIVLIAMLVTAAAFVIQSYFSGFQSHAGPFSLVADLFRDQRVPASKSRANAFPTPIATPGSAGTNDGLLHSLLSAHDVEHPTAIVTSADIPQTALVLRPAHADSTGIALDVHADKDALLQHDDSDAKHWHELEEHQKARWKENLKAAGHWVEEEGETVFKGILFSEYAGVIGGAVADMLHG